VVGHQTVTYSLVTMSMSGGQHPQHPLTHLSLKECSCRCLNIMEADSSTAVGLAMPLPATSLLTWRAPCACVCGGGGEAGGRGAAGRCIQWFGGTGRGTGSWVVESS
jgi:hypothetical protein